MRIDTGADDADLGRLIEAATAAVEGQTGLTLRATDFELRLDCWADPIALPAAPFRAMIEVAYLDADAVEQIIDAADYHVVRSREGAHLHFLDGFSRPTIAARDGALRVRFSAGYDDPATSGSGDDAELVLPEPAIMAALFLVGHWHQTRESVAGGGLAEAPQSFGYLTSQLRIFR